MFPPPNCSHSGAHSSLVFSAKSSLVLSGQVKSSLSPSSEKRPVAVTVHCSGACSYLCQCQVKCCLVQSRLDRVLPEEGGEPLDVAVTVEFVPVEPQLAQPLQGGEGGGQVGQEVVLDAQHLQEDYCWNCLERGFIW